MALVSSRSAEKRKRLKIGLGVSALTAVVTVGIFASNNWFPRTDTFSGKRYGWFGKELAKNAPNAWNPLAIPSPMPTPQLSKEYVYAGSRLLAVEDKNASAAPPADLAVWRPSNGTWYVNDGTSWYSASWGQNGDIPVPGDYDGDGKTDFSIFRPGTGTCPCSVTWYIIHSSTNSQVSFQYAVNGDLPAQADYDGDGKTDAAVYRPSNYTWYIQGSSAGFYTQVWGDSGDVPAPADYDGDGKADMGVWRSSNSTFYSIDSSDLDQQSVAMSQSGVPVSGDYDGDGKADYALFAASGGNWFVRQSSTTSIVTITGWGQGGDVPVQNDYDGDGRIDHTVWRSSNGYWYIRNSSDLSNRSVQWGENGDIPVPAFYRR